MRRVRSSKTTTVRALALAGVSTLVLSTIMPAIAQEKPGIAVSEEIIVTARKREESIMKAPVLIQAITPRQIEDLHITKIEALSTVAPGTYIHYGFGAVGITAYMRGLGNAPQATTVDQTLSLNIDGFATASGTLFRSGIFDVAQIEVMKGPQSLFFGKSTAAGVIAISSADPTPAWDSKVSLGYEFNADEIDVNGYISGPLTDNLGIRIAGFHRDSKGYLYDPTPGQTSKRLPATTDDGARLTLKYDNSDMAFRAKLKVAYTKSESNTSIFSLNQRVCPYATSPLATAPLDNCKLDTLVSGAPAGLPYKENFNFSRTDPTDWAVATGHPLFRDGKPYSENETAMAVLNMDYEITEGLKATSVTALSYINGSEAGVNAQSIGYIDIAGQVKFNEWSEELRLTSDWKDRWYNFIVGGLLNGQRKADITPLSFRNNAVAAASRLFRGNRTVTETTNNSVFGQVLLTPIEQWELSAGLRYTKITKETASIIVINNLGIPNSLGERVQDLLPSQRKYSEDATTPEFTLSYKPSDDLTAFVSYKHGYKGPAMGSLASLTTVTPTTVAAQAPIRGEKAKGIEGGVKAQLFDRQVALTATGYRYNYTDLQVSFILPLSQTAVITNAASTRVQGMELGVDYRPEAIPGLTLNAFVNYNDTYYKSFTRATCYTGQTVALGCVGGVADLSGRNLPMAPKWVGNIGGDYRWDLNDDYTASLHADVQYSSSHLSSAALDPVGRMGSYALINAGVRIGKSDNSWELGLLCRDCNNKIFVVNGTDGGTNPSSVTVNIGRPRQVLLQLTVKPNLL